MLEALVALLLAHHGFHWLTKHRRQGLLPQLHIILPQRHLRLGQLGRVGHDLLGHLHEGLAESHLVLHVKRATVLLAVQEFLDDHLALLGHMREKLGHLRRIGHLDFRHLEFWGFLLSHA